MRRNTLRRTGRNERLSRPARRVHLTAQTILRNLLPGPDVQPGDNGIHRFRLMREKRNFTGHDEKSPDAGEEVSVHS
ncbi:hypothetical protein GCM10010221_71260 [Streptomyces parvus]|nr:hypothetical protein GCM10010221_71260 [Streptomyces parvus]